MFEFRSSIGSLVVVFSMALTASAGVGDPQLGTDHPWYPGELASSTFDRLAASQGQLFERLIGHPPQSDQDRALAAWMWRNLHYAHGEEGAQDLWGKGFRGGDTTTREYWTGQFAHGFGLCGTTHAQWTAELNALLGHGRSRTVGVLGHNSCEVFLKGGPYGEGRWALLDHDVSTIVMDPSGSRMLSIDEIRNNLTQLIDPKFEPQRQQGWPLGGLHPDDPKAFAEYRVAEYLPGYAGPPPMVHLRRGETLRRYFEPGLDDGKTFVFWGRNYRTGGIPGPERSRTWVNQPEKFLNTPAGTGYRPGQARFGNAVYTYRPNFRDGSYREGVISQNEQQVVFEFQTPFIIAATPADDSDWGIYELGCRNGLVIRGRGIADVAVSVDRGASWHDAGTLESELDLTDHVKGHRQYWLRLGIPAGEIENAELETRTVCQANPAMFPRLKDLGSTVRFAASRRAIVSAGPNLAQAQQHIIAGQFDSPRVTLELATPRGEVIDRLYAASHIASSAPPDPSIRYQIEHSLDGGRSWQPVVQDWQIVRQGNEPSDFWSQSFCYGDIQVAGQSKGPVQVRFRNDGGKRNLRAETHLTYVVPGEDRCRAKFVWTDDRGENRTAEHVFSQTEPANWTIDTGVNVKMKSVEFSVDPR
ncbi:MAG: hypothetical protein ACO1RT_12480 [Planctomycetaceae bacterium]